MSMSDGESQTILRMMKGCCTAILGGGQRDLGGSVACAHKNPNPRNRKDRDSAKSRLHR